MSDFLKFSNRPRSYTRVLLQKLSTLTKMAVSYHDPHLISISIMLMIKTTMIITNMIVSIIIMITTIMIISIIMIMTIMIK